jgi:hypothetical protein
MRYFAGALFVLAISSPALAQSAGRFAAGAAVGTRIAPSPAVGGGTGLSLLWRVGHSKEGFGWEWGFNWFSSRVDRSIGEGVPFELGKLRIRPFMVGYGYTHILGANAIKGSVQGGYAFDSFKVGQSASDVYRERLGAQSLSADAANTFVVRPQVSLWHDLSPKLGLNATAGYMIARPKLTVRTTVGEERARVRADALMLKIGLVYSVF